MGQPNTRNNRARNAHDALPRIFTSEADAEREMLQERWRIGQEADLAERARRLHILNEVVHGKLGDERALRLLRETTALKGIIKHEGWTMHSISHLEALIYGVCDAHASFESPLWRGQVAPATMRLASADEVTHYCPDSTGVNAVPPPPKKRSDSVMLSSGDRLVAQDDLSQGVLEFMRHYLQPDEDAPNAMVDFHREMRIRENYAQRTEHAMEAAFNMYSIAKDFSQVLLRSQTEQRAETREALALMADELLMEFNLERYGLLALLKKSHWQPKEQHVQEDRQFVQKLSRDLLMHALADASYALPTTNEHRANEYQSDDHATVESYFASAYQHIERVLGIRPHRDRVVEVPAVDESMLDKPIGRVH